MLRPVASGGCVNAYETYVAVNHVTTLEPGIWRYLPLSHELLWVKSQPALQAHLVEAFTNPSQDQHYAAQAAVVFFWTCFPYRGEWPMKR